MDAQYQASQESNLRDTQTKDTKGRLFSEHCAWKNKDVQADMWAPREWDLLVNDRTSRSYYRAYKSDACCISPWNDYGPEHGVNTVL